MRYNIGLQYTCLLFLITVILTIQAQETVKDMDGNDYRTVKIGYQVWMKDNLKVSRSPEGNPVPAVCYDNVSANCDTFGKLYTWYEVMNGSTTECARGICPEGWHIPSDSEWKILEMALGMSREEVDRGDSYPWRGTDEGTKLSVSGSSGFDFLEAGRRNSDNSFAFKNQSAYFWTSTQADDTAYAWRRCFANNDPGIGRWSTFQKSFAFSVRCIKDEILTAEEVINRVIASYTKIESFEADAEIVKVNPCNVMRNNGLYTFHKPESAAVVI